VIGTHVPGPDLRITEEKKLSWGDCYSKGSSISVKSGGICLGLASVPVNSGDSHPLDSWGRIEKTMPEVREELTLPENISGKT
jgi:hypothetical protein